MLLAIDTSTAIASIALYQERVLAECTWDAGQNQTREVLPQIQNLLGVLDASVAAISAVGVALGPGGFNGLRVGIATAKAICAANDLPIVGVETLRATAYQYRVTYRPVRPLFDAGRGEVATGLYQAADDLFGTLEEPRLTRLEDALRDSPPETLFCGELRPAWREAIRARFGPDRHEVRPAEATRRAGYLAELAWQLVQVGIVDDPATLQPIYLRRPPIHGAARATGSTTP